MKKPRARRRDQRHAARVRARPDDLSREGELQGSAFVEKMCRYYAYLNPGLTMILNGKKFRSKDGLLDLLREEMDERAALRADPPERARTSRSPSPTPRRAARSTTRSSTASTPPRAAPTWRRSARRSCRCCAGSTRSSTTPSDIRAGIEAAICVRVEEPVFE